MGASPPERGLLWAPAPCPSHCALVQGLHRSGNSLLFPRQPNMLVACVVPRPVPEETDGPKKKPMAAAAAHLP